jgi:transposase
MKILSLDLGKSKTVACEYVVETGEAKFCTVRTHRDSIVELLDRYQPDRLVLEICPAAGWLCDLAISRELPFQVANTSAPAWRWSNTKRKTDRDDALRLAQLSALNQLPEVHVPRPAVRQWRSLIRSRHHIVRRGTQVKNRIRAILEREGETLAAGRKGWTKANVACLKAMAKPLDEVSVEELWRGELWLELQALSAIQALLVSVEEKLDQLAASSKRCGLLQTIPGVGPRLAEIVVAMIDDPHRFQNAKQVGSYVGLVPRQYQSGASDRLGHISRQGNGLLRAMLVEISWIGLRYNSWMRDVYEQVRRGSPSRKKTAIVAVARRLLIRCWAMLRDQTPWRPMDDALPCMNP